MADNTIIYEIKESDFLYEMRNHHFPGLQPLRVKFELLTNPDDDPKSNTYQQQVIYQENGDTTIRKSLLPSPFPALSV